MNVLALKVEHDWRVQRKHRKFDYRMPLVFLSSLLRSRHATSDPVQADAYFLPDWDFQGAWGNPEVHYRTARYVSQAYPYWNASGGRDHLWAVARDAGACATPWGSLLEEMNASMILTNWGGVTGLSGRVEERCFYPHADVVVPGTLTHAVVELSPFWRSAAERAALDTARSTLLFFFGALCWKTDERADSLPKLRHKCQRSFSAPGFLSHYSFGLRYELFDRFRNADGFKVYATDYPPSLNGARVQLDDEISKSTFCFCPSGTGWGMRVYHVMVLGCIPVIAQHDGTHPRVTQAFEPELDWGLLQRARQSQPL